MLVNAQTERLFGYSRDELLGQPLELLVPESVRNMHPKHRQEYASDPVPRPMGAGMELAGRRRDGTEFPAEISLSAIDTTDGVIISAAVRDVTERQRAERKFRGLLEAAPDAIVGVDEAGIIVLVNAQTERLFGYPRAELLGQALEVLIPESARDRHPKHRDGYLGDPHPRPMGAGMELAGRRRDGSEFPAEISLSAIETETGVMVSAAVRDVTEQKIIQKQLREQNAELERLSQVKDSFLASMSHELRTPLNAIIGFTGTLLMGLPGPLNAEQEHQLRTVEHSGRHLLAIINDILDLARIESGAVQIQLEEVDCVPLVENVASTVLPLAADKGLKLVLEMPSQPVVVKSDTRALGQILINLVGNAIKFTEAGEVRVVLSGADDGTQISISDTGPGIAESELRGIFNAFERGSRINSTTKEGTGLGLYISHKLSELVGAQIAVQTELGVGSTFTIELGPAH